MENASLRQTSPGPDPCTHNMQREELCICRDSGLEAPRRVTGSPEKGRKNMDQLLQGSAFGSDCGGDTCNSYFTLLVCCVCVETEMER